MRAIRAQLRTRLAGSNSYSDGSGPAYGCVRSAIRLRLFQAGVAKTIDPVENRAITALTIREFVVSSGNSWREC